MKQVSAEEILLDKDLKKTNVRVQVLDSLLNSPTALSQSQLEEHFAHQFDRITLYRTLKLYEEKGIIHRIYNSFGEAKYAACSNHCHEHSHSDHHLHFNCLKCKSTYCINSIEIPAFELPEGMLALQYNFSVEGVCEKCREV